LGELKDGVEKQEKSRHHATSLKKRESWLWTLASEFKTKEEKAALAAEFWTKASRKRKNSGTTPPVWKRESGVF
jgi:hypothetical protein